MLFGIGWGLSGYCPGPLLTSLGTLRGETLTGFLCFLAGLFLSLRLNKRG